MSEVEFLEPLDENGERDDGGAVEVGSDGEEHNVSKNTKNAVSVRNSSVANT